MATLYRAASRAEYDDYHRSRQFNTSINTLEAKQFFKSLIAVKAFVKSAVQQEYEPPYTYLFILTVNDKQLSRIAIDEMDLDGFEAISVPEEMLPAFNNCITFVKEKKL
jgi:hypothetical protein